MNPSPSGRVRFGAFVLDVRSGELMPAEARNGVRTIVLQEQPLQILRLLIERNGELATREEIRKNLWPNDTAVDFNHSINVAIGSLRRALGDSTEKPLYIETVARRGYRLIAQTEWVKTGEEPPTAHPIDDAADQSPTPLSAPELAGLIGKKVSHYRVLEVIGGGGMGMVYKAEDLKLGRRVALKFLPELTSDPLSLLRFEREAQTASSLNHANICTIHGIEEYQSQPFIVMELLEGETLRDRLAASSPLPLGDLMSIAAQVGKGLEAAHGQGIIHRDIKPANIFLTRQGVVKILDFGLAKLAASDEQQEGPARSAPTSRRSSDQRSSAVIQEADASLTRTGMAIGTAGYMSPEQIRKEKLDARTDLFSFGLVLYEMATGRRPFNGETAEAVHQAILTQEPLAVHDLNPAIPLRVAVIIARALEKERGERYQSAADMCADLQALQTQKRRVVHRHAASIAAALLVIAVISAGWIFWRSRNPFTLSANDTVVLADVSNQTSDPIFDDALNTALRVALEQTPFLNLLAQDKVRGTLELLHHPDERKLTPEIAREVCLRTHSKAVIAGSIADAGNHFELELDGVDCANSRTFASVKRNVASRNEIVRSLGILAVALRGKLGEPRDSLMKFNKPLDEATSSSLEALQLLTQAYRRHAARDPSTASYYQRAIESDPNLALAYIAQGAAYSNQREMQQASAAEKKAYELRNRLTVPARFLAETLYYDLCTGEVEKALPVYQEWVRTFPLDVRAHINLSYRLYQLGYFDRATAESREAVRLLPSIATYGNLITSAIQANRLDEAKAAFHEAEARGIDTPDFHDWMHMVGFLQQDEPAMREQLAWALGHGEIAQGVFYGEAGVQAYYGHFRIAAQWLDRANTAATKANLAEGNLSREVEFALQQAEVGKISSRTTTASLVAQAQDRDIGLLCALLLARSGNVQRAGQLANTFKQQFPLDTLIQSYVLPAIHASIQLQQNDPAGAIESLRPAIRYDLTFPESFNSVYPAYLRGVAFLGMKNGKMAIPEFQKVIDHPAIVGRFVTGALARLQLGRAQAMAGDRGAARNSYLSFLDMWKGADPEIPIYRKAKAELANLK